MEDLQQVSAIKLLLEKLHPDNDRLFQRARSGIKASDPVLYTCQAVSHHLPGCMMKRLSESAGLSKRYTNHCVRATTVTLLKQQGVEDRKVCLLTGDKAERSLVSYNVPDKGERRKMASYLDEKAPSAKTGLSESTAGGGFNIVAPGAVFNNLMVNIVQDASPKRCFNLSRSFLKKRKLADGSAEEVCDYLPCDGQE